MRWFTATDRSIRARRSLPELLLSSGALEHTKRPRKQSRVRRFLRRLWRFIAAQNFPC